MESYSSYINYERRHVPCKRLLIFWLLKKEICYPEIGPQMGISDWHIYSALCGIYQFKFTIYCWVVIEISYVHLTISAENKTRLKN